MLRIKPLVLPDRVWNERLSEYNSLAELRCRISIDGGDAAHMSIEEGAEIDACRGF